MILNNIFDNRILRRALDIYLPDFTVLTGGNGSGKTQLLEYIRDTANGSANTNEFGEYEYNDFGDAINILYPLLQDDRKPLIDIVYSYPGLKNDIYTLPFGGTNLLEAIKSQWDGLEMIVWAYHMQRDKVFLNENHELQEISTAVSNLVAKAIQPPQYGGGQPALKPIQPYQLLQIKKLAETSGKQPGDLQYLDLITFYDIPLNLFSAALDLLFHQFFLKKKYYPHLTKDITPPWDIFNKILERADFQYRAIYTESNNDDTPLPVRLIDNDNGNHVTFEELSSGETTIMALIFALYNSTNDGHFPEVILFDEPDAHLHPSLTQTFLDVIQDVLIGEHQVKVILTTHSPSTVALSPNDSIYIMDRTLGHPVKGNQKNALSTLSNGLTSITIEESDLGIAYNIRNTSKHILFTEGITDKIILEIAWKKLFPNQNPQFFIQDCFDATFLGNLFSRGDDLPDGIFRQFQDKKMIALFDFDSAGYNSWNRDKKFSTQFENNPKKGLAISNGKNALRMLLSVPEIPEMIAQVIKPDGTTYKHLSHLTIESWFFLWGLVRHFFTEDSATGGGVIHVIKDSSKRQLSNIIKDLPKSDFSHFKVLFETINRFLK
jgi:ABC-type cobalamin/Fe3+-siderophores transport system ATPase subunit